jgi:hypothetical protein
MNRSNNSTSLEEERTEPSSTRNSRKCGQYSASSSFSAGEEASATLLAKE